MTIRAAFFDVGEVLVDETREYGTWADWLGVPRHTFATVFGAIIAQGKDYRETFQIFQPGFDLATERRRRAEAGQPESFGEEDLYADVRPCLSALRDQGLTVGVAGNQTARAEGILRELRLPIDILGTSDSWEVEKPSTAFFERILREANVAAAHVLYVGDRLDNDILPAVNLGMNTAVLRRGPWGHILRGQAAIAVLGEDVERCCLFHLDGLTELPDLVREYNTGAS